MEKRELPQYQPYDALSYSLMLLGVVAFTLTHFL